MIYKYIGIYASGAFELIANSIKLNMYLPIIAFWHKYIHGCGFILNVHKHLWERSVKRSHQLGVFNLHKIFFDVYINVFKNKEGK